TDPIRCQYLAIFQFHPDQVESIEISKPDQPPVAVAREKGQWSLTKGEGTLNKNNVDSLANTLATLRAVRWVGLTAPEHGFEKPALVVAFTTADKKPHKLTLGSK